MPKSLTIVKGIPLPSPHNRYRWNEMEVGDSFWAPIKSACLSSAIAYRNRHYGERYTCRTEDGGTRVWRVE